MIQKSLLYYFDLFRFVVWIWWFVFYYSHIHNILLLLKLTTTFTRALLATVIAWIITTVIIWGVGIEGVDRYVTNSSFANSNIYWNLALLFSFENCSVVVYLLP